MSAFVAGKVLRMGYIRHTLRLASAHAATTTPTVNAATLPTCTLLYLLPIVHPTAIVCTLPKLLRIICMGTEMSKAKAQLLSMLTLKNMSERSASRLSGILGRASPKLPFCFAEEEERDWSCEGRAKRAVRRNWMSVMRRPLMWVSWSFLHMSCVEDGYLCWAHICVCQCLINSSVAC